MDWRKPTIILIEHVRNGLDWLNDELAAVQGALHLARVKAMEPPGPQATWFHGPIRSGPDPLRHVHTTPPWDPDHPSVRPHWDYGTDLNLARLRATAAERAANPPSDTDHGDDAA
jgi:hypothetical protein